MIARIIPYIYDIEGKRTGKPVSRMQKHLFQTTFPMQRYLSQPLSKQMKDINEMHLFLKSCKYVSDREQFNQEDYWTPPEEFEKTRKGDCDCFALWAWRTMLEMGYDARYVVGISGKYGEGHAWVTFEKNGTHFLIEPLASLFGKRLPSLSTVTYHPMGSVKWNGKELQYFIHEKCPFHLKFSQIPYLLGEWFICWAWFLLRLTFVLILFPFFLLRKRLHESLRKKTGEQ